MFVKSVQKKLMETYENIVNENDGVVNRISMEEWVNKFNNEDYEYDRDPGAKLQLANELFGGYGVEAITDENAWVSKYWQNTIALYVNMGDTYDDTIVYDTANDEFIATSWGDWYEKWQGENESEELDESQHKNFYIKANSVGDDGILCLHNQWKNEPEENEIKWFRTHKAAKKHIEKRHYGNVTIVDANDNYSKTDSEENVNEAIETFKKDGDIYSIDYDVHVDWSKKKSVENRNMIIKKNKKDLFYGTKEKVWKFWRKLKSDINESSKYPFDYTINFEKEDDRTYSFDLSIINVKNNLFYDGTITAPKQERNPDEFNWNIYDSEELEFFDGNWEDMEELVSSELSNFIANSRKRK